MDILNSFTNQYFATQTQLIYEAQHKKKVAKYHGK
jgi:hypothetical protein